MKDDTFELLTKMYADFTLQFKEVKGDISTLKGDVSTLKGSTLKLEMKLENEINRKIDILLETRCEVNKRLDIIEDKIDIISAKVEKHDIEIKVIKAAK